MEGVKKFKIIIFLPSPCSLVFGHFLPMLENLPLKVVLLRNLGSKTTLFTKI